MERKRKRKNEGFTGKVELVGRIKMKPPPCGQKRLGHERHSVWRLKNLVTLALLMNTLQRRRSRRRRRSVVRLPKRHFTEAPDFLFRERLLTVNSHLPPESDTRSPPATVYRRRLYFLNLIRWGDRFLRWCVWPFYLCMPVRWIMYCRYQNDDVSKLAGFCSFWLGSGNGCGWCLGGWCGGDHLLTGTTVRISKYGFSSISLVSFTSHFLGPIFNNFTGIFFLKILQHLKKDSSKIEGKIFLKYDNFKNSSRIV